MQLSIYKSTDFNIILVGIFISILLSNSGCKKYVQVPPPSTQLVTASVFDNAASATAAQTVIYTQMEDQSYIMAQSTGLLSDELNNNSTNSGNIQFYRNAMTAATGPGPWSSAYNYIYQANAIISALQNNNNIVASIRNQLTGESLFIRAFWHFYLTNLYGDIPLVTTTNYVINSSISRTSQALVYQQIISDLQTAQDLLSQNYVDETDTTATTQRVRPTKWAAMALLARVYLYTGQYANAETQATSVINSGLYNLANLQNDGVFKANSSEAIWQLAIPLPASNTATPDGTYFILISAPGTGINNSNTLSTNLLSSFEPGDARRTNWIDSIKVGSLVYYFPYKYKVQNSSAATPSEYVMVLRLAEQYLIRAEAEARLGDMINAANDLNTIRSRANLGPSPTLTASSSLQQADSAILHERQVELFTEWGNRWLDLTRTANINGVMGGNNGVCAAKGGSWASTDSLYPIPQSEITLDANLTQNPGY